MVPNIYQKLDSVMCTFSNMSILNILFEKMILFSPISGRLGIEHVFRTGLDRCPLYTCNGKKTRIHQHIFFFVIFQLLINVNLLFNSWNIMIEPIYHCVLVYLLKNNMKILLCIKAWPSGWDAWINKVKIPGIDTWQQSVVFLLLKNKNFCNLFLKSSFVLQYS